MSVEKTEGIQENFDNSLSKGLSDQELTQVNGGIGWSDVKNFAGGIINTLSGDLPENLDAKQTPHPE